MKPIKLTIKGLQSFEQEQVIDFFKLTEFGIFGIFGETGSGKSTILDAITFAIYGDIVRIRESRADKLEHLININSNEMRVAFIFQLNQDKYEIIREIKLKKNERLISSKKQFLIKNDNIVADKDISIKQEIENIIGLSIEDFTRSVILPQGKFNEFLKLSGSDRRNMLERLFNLEKYGKKLIEKVRTKIIQITTDINAKENQILGKGSFSEEELENSINRLKEIGEINTLLSNEIETLQGNFFEKEKIFKLQEEHQILINKKLEFENQKNEILKIKENIDLSEKSKILNEIHIKILNIKDSIDNYNNNLNKINIETSYLNNHIQEKNNILLEINKILEELSKEKEINFVSLQEKNYMNEISNKINSYKNNTANITKEIREKELNDSEIENKTIKLKELLKEIENKKKFLDEINEIKDSQLYEYELAIEKLNIEKIEFLEGKLKNIEKEILEKENMQNQLKLEIHTLEIEFDKIKKNQIENISAKIAKTLKDNEPCPCCGSKIHPNINSKDFSDYEDNENKIKLIESKINKLKIEYETLNISKDIERKIELENEIGENNSEKLKIEKSHLILKLDNLKKLKSANEQKKSEINKKILEIENVRKKVEEELWQLKAKNNNFENNIIVLKESINQLALFFKENGYDITKDVIIKEISEKIRLSYLKEEKFEKISKEYDKKIKEKEAVLIEVQTHSENLNLQMGNYNRIKGTVLELNTQLLKESENLKGKLVEFNIDYLFDYKNSILDDDEKNNLIIRVKNYEKSYEEICNNLKYLNAKIEGVERISKENLINIENNLKIKKENFENLKTEEINLVSQIEKLKKIKIEIGEMTKEINNLTKELGKYEELSKLFIGNAFVEFLAIGKLKNIAYNASQKLNKISNGHYALTVNEDSDFLIIDNYNNGETRRVATLSGGESFLVSLSLALALSSQIQLKNQANLEFFFLDEGFGTLDSNLLEKVIESLENLKNNEKINIGLITHIEDLKERIPKKLLVSPPVSGERGSTVELI